MNAQIWAETEILQHRDREVGIPSRTLLAARRMFAKTVFLRAFVVAASLNLFADNPDFVVDRSETTPFVIIGLLTSNRTVEMDGRQQNLGGTGFLVSPCYVLTVAHVVFGQGGFPEDGVDYSMTFWIGPGSDRSFAAKIQAFPDLRFGRIGAGGDWVLLKLPDSKCIGAHPKIGWLEPLTRDLVPGERLAAAGFGSDHPFGELSLSYGTIRGRGHDGLLLFDGSFAPGASGGPVLAVEDGVLKVAGLVTESIDPDGTHVYPHYADTHAGEIQPIDGILNDPAVKAVLDSDRARFNRPNPAAPRLRLPLPERP
jgi:hypothetical protein